MPNVIVGLNSAGFITSSALVVDGKVVFAAEEERLIREKRSRKFPLNGIQQALKVANLAVKDVTAFATAWNPAINLEAHLPAQSERHRYLGEIFYNVPSYLLSLYGKPAGDYSYQTIRLEGGLEIPIYYIHHHLSHASAFFFSPFEEAAVLSVDAFGEKDSVMFAEGRGNRLKALFTQEFPHSLGGFYATFTEFCGFKPQSDEWKLMGASSYGDPERFYHPVRSLVKLIPDGGFELDLTYFSFYQFHRPGRFTAKLSTLLGLTPNRQGVPPNQDYYDLSAAAQKVTEEIYFHLLRSLQKMSGQKQVVLSGGVALNSVANGKVLTNTPFNDLYIPSVPDDSGGSLGAAFYLYHQIQGNARSFVLDSNYLGPQFSDAEIEETLKRYKLEYTRLASPSKTAAELIAAGKIIGWFQGRLEFGDRALGNRSILADPRDPSMKDKVNASIKYREAFRPFAPSILAEMVEDYFVDAQPTPFMEKVSMIREEKRQQIPAVTHIDGSGRLQTVRKETNPLYYQLISEFKGLTGIPIVLNTSFNLNGEAIVCSPSDAIRTLYSSGLDALVVGSYLIEKNR